MKIGILTYHDADNFGAVLQAYALKECIKAKKIASSVEIINYKSANIINDSKTIRFNRSSLKLFLRSTISVIYRIIYLRTILRRKASFNKFRRMYLDISKKEFRKCDDIQGYDIYITGSDQVWNCEINGFDSTYFLSFSNKNNNIAYAASIGKNYLNKNEAEFIKKHIENIGQISVRESSTIEILKQLTYEKVTHVLDPTLLIDLNVWNKLITDKKHNNGYILLYTLSGSEEVLEAAYNFSKKLGLDVWCINNTLKRNKYGFKNIGYVGPVEFIDLLRNAEFIVTNSFHGTTFSILYQKNFVTIPHKTRGERMKNLLCLLNLEDRLIEHSGQIQGDFKIEINYSITNKLLEKERERSLSFLNQAIENSRQSLDQS